MSESEKDIFFQMDSSYRNPYFHKHIEHELKWFWMTKNCAEPIGPFNSREEAEKDFREHGK